MQGHTALGSWSYLGPIILGVHVYSGQCLQLQTILLDSARPYWGPNNSAGVKQPDSWQVRGLKGSEDQELCQLSIFILAGQRLPKRVLVRAREIREAGPKTWTHIRHPKLTWEGKETVITPSVWFSVSDHIHTQGAGPTAGRVFITSVLLCLRVRKEGRGVGHSSVTTLYFPHRLHILKLITHPSFFQGSANFKWSAPLSREGCRDKEKNWGAPKLLEL